MRSEREASPRRNPPSVPLNPSAMNRRDIALASIRREVEESGELTVIALRTAQEHRIGYAAMMAAAREGLRRRKLAAERSTPSSYAQTVDPCQPSTGPPVRD